MDNTSSGTFRKNKNTNKIITQIANIRGLRYWFATVRQRKAVYLSVELGSVYFFFEKEELLIKGSQSTELGKYSSGYPHQTIPLKLQCTRLVELVHAPFYFALS
jgi:hypothetical protein